MASLSVAGHVLKALGRAIGRVLLTFVIVLVVVGGGYAVLHLALATNHSDTLSTYLVAIALGVGWGVAVSSLVLMGEVIKVAIEAARDTAKDVEHAVGDVARTVEGRGQK